MWNFAYSVCDISGRGDDELMIWLQILGWILMLLPLAGILFVEIHRETDSVLESLAATLCIILLAWLLFAAVVGIIVFPYYFITVLLR